jgi:outer membrane protein assembly factor BamB
VTPGPVVGSDGIIYLASNAGILHAIDPATGKDLWTVDGGGPATGETDLSTSPLILSDGSLLWPGPQDTLLEISQSGSVLWTHRFSGQVLSPIRSGTTVYVMTMDGTLTALRLGAPDPTVAWSVSLGHTAFGSPVLAGPGLVVTTAGSDVVAVDDHGTSGVIDWRRSLSAEVEVSASTDVHGDVFVSDNKGEAYSFSKTGHLNWTRAVGDESYSSSSVTSGGLLYIGDNRGDLSVVRSATGSPVRVIHAGGGLWAGQVIDRRGDVYLGTRAASIVGFGPAGHLLFRIPVSGDIDSYPALTATGTLIVGDESGTVYAVGASG